MQGCARCCSNAIYITVGTRLGMGVYLNGVLHHEISYPEGEHMFINEIPKGKAFVSSCTFQDSCIEGLAA